MANWFTFLRSEEHVTATVTVNYGIDAATEIPQRPMLFLVVRNLDQPSDRTAEELEAALCTDLENGGALVVGGITMDRTRTIVAYGNDETRARQALGAYDGAVAFQAKSDPEWQIYRTLLPSDAELANAT